MVDMFKALMTRQFEAALCTLNMCIERCPEPAWDAPVANLTFCQAVFHALFYADVYLGQNTESLRQQAFHRDHPDFFRDYEELEDQEQRLLYDRDSIIAYIAFCRCKAVEVIAAETAETLGARCGFDRLPFSRAELYVYNLRHIQHHAAQLALHLRRSAGINIPWVGSAWRA